MSRRFYLLSGRERDVVRGLLAGKKRAAIASELGVSEGTIRTLVSRAYRKIGVSSRYELVLRAPAEWLREARARSDLLGQRSP